ncbi:helix-turn-helix domain-containing protein [Rhodoligotrophos appendicifer]|uniref:helix-turn-helix domain-containing protein n=1 Tax=Rhodoligotrophos appendicifer TaxID=987056 RepID=UPI00117EE543|nr:helix-turn-helix transcriptional regulator [Rhodoligotrophos appendicifer]
MTPFGQKMRELRELRGISLKEMAASVGVSSAYLSALEHGRRGRPSWTLLQRIITYFNVIWDEAEDLAALAQRSHPRVVIDTSHLTARATETANLMSERIAKLSEEQLENIATILRSQDELR